MANVVAMFTFRCSINASRITRFYTSVLSQNMHTCGCVHKSNTGNREAKFMVKIMKGSSHTKKRHWYDHGTENGSFLIGNNAETIGTSGGGKPNAKRRAVLNKLYMRHITEQMSCDEVTSGKGIRITKIQVTGDLKQVNIYWICDSTSKEGAFLPTLLDHYAHSLRHSLSQLRIVGQVPPIRFVADKERALGVNVDIVLKTADMGDIEEDVQRYPDWLVAPLEDLNPGEVFPPMRNDVLGLDQAEMMSKVKRILKKQSNKEQVLGSVSSISNLEAINAEIAKFQSSKKTFKEKRHHKPKERVSVQQDWMEDVEDQEEDFIEEEGDTPIKK